MEFAKRLLICALMLSSLAAAQIRVQKKEGQQYINVVDLAASRKMEAKLVSRALLTICSNPDDGEICIPIRLTNDNHIFEPSDSSEVESLFLSRESISRALQIDVKTAGGSVVLQQTKQLVTDAPPAWNAAWGKGRGFGIGQTVPDIPLTNMEGEEVRLSQFLGKRYILYCWASW